MFFLLTRTGIDGSEQFQMGPEHAEPARIAGPLKRNYQLLHRLRKRLRRLQLVDDALHVRLVRRVAVQQSRPLVGRDAQTRLSRYLDYLGVVFAPQSFVGSELFFELHERGVALPF